MCTFKRVEDRVRTFIQIEYYVSSHMNFIQDVTRLFRKNHLKNI